MIFRLGELFCGPGGLAWGAAHANIGDPEWGIHHAWANDYSLRHRLHGQCNTTSQGDINRALCSCA